MVSDGPRAHRAGDGSSTPSDAQRARALLAGDAEAVDQARAWLQAAFRPYRRPLGDELEDLEQEVLIDLLDALRAGRFDGRSKLRTFVYSFANHKCIDRLRARGRREMVPITDLELRGVGPTPLDDAARAQRLQLALKVFRGMSESCQELWRLIEAGASYRDMSRRLGVSEATLRARVLRCRRKALELRDEFRRPSSSR
ncbi:MAG: sigma-70 family RNA polymerase sigma factor [Acidobacteriota bacterium]